MDIITTLYILLALSIHIGVDKAAGDVCCGHHMATECSRCDQGKGGFLCKGDCEWTNNKCAVGDVPKVPVLPQGVSCGGHDAPDCSKCKIGFKEESTYCNGDCKWVDNNCILSGNDYTDVSLVICGVDPGTFTDPEILVHSWKVKFKNEGEDMLTIKANGKVSSTVEGRTSYLEPSDNPREFPASRGWWKVRKLFGDSTWMYLRVGSNGKLEIHRFCLDGCKNIYKELDEYCCKGTGNVRGSDIRRERVRYISCGARSAKYCHIDEDCYWIDEQCVFTEEEDGDEDGKNGDGVDFCEEHHTVYWGGRNVKGVRKKLKTTDERECFILCDGTTECKRASFHKRRKTCLLKVSGRKRRNKSYISWAGIKGCNPENKEEEKQHGGKIKGEHKSCGQLIKCEDDIKGESGKEHGKKEDGGPSSYVLKSRGGAEYKYTELMGIYRVTQRMHNSFPIYKQEDGPGFTYVDDIGNWVVAKNNLQKYPKMYSAERPVLSTPPATKWFYELNNKWMRDTTVSMVSSN